MEYVVMSDGGLIIMALYLFFTLLFFYLQLASGIFTFVTCWTLYSL